MYRAALHLLTDSGTWLSDQRRQSVISPHAQDQESFHRTSTLSSGDHRQDQYGARRFRRLSARIGKAKAVIATARKIAILFYNAMRFGMAYQDPGADHYEKSIASVSGWRQS